MTQEEKAKAYDEAIEKAKKELNTCGSQDCDAARQIFRLFPELKESDDENIRKEIISTLKYANHKGVYDKHLAWLEKQGERKHKSDVTCRTTGYWVVEQKAADKVKPKFKVGDRVNKNDREDEEHCILTITSVNIDEHCYICNQCSVIDFGEQDLWHIVEKKPAWSEEDEERLQSCLNILQAKGLMGVTDTVNTKWLKSLKQRYTWKPSEHELEVLRLAAEKDGTCLMGLYKQLKKLREE